MKKSFSFNEITSIPSLGPSAQLKYDEESVARLRQEKGYFFESNAISAANSLYRSDVGTKYGVWSQSAVPYVQKLFLVMDGCPTLYTFFSLFRSLIFPMCGDISSGTEVLLKTFKLPVTILAFTVRNVFQGGYKIESK